MKYVVLGAGPTGITVVHELLLKGVSPKSITVIDSSKSNHLPEKGQALTRKQSSVLDTVLRERPSKGLGKSGISLTDGQSLFESPSSYWGVSCLPPLNWSLGSEIYTPHQVKEAYSKVASEWEIQAENSMDSDFEISGEYLGFLRRKQASLAFVKAGYASHSRLAISTSNQSGQSGCKLSANCFAGCPNSAPWNPHREILRLKKQHPEINFCYQKINGIEIKEKILNGTNHNVYYDKLFLSAGANATKILLQPLFAKKIQLENSPVIIVPLVFKKKISNQDYYESFLFTDLVVPRIKNKKLTGLMQIYLPTKEITGRVITQLPRFLHRLLAKELQTFFGSFFKRIGIGMIFLESKVVGEELPEADEIRESIRDFKKLLKNSGILPLPFLKKLLLNGASYHLGSIHLRGEELKGIDSQIYQDLSANDVFVTDTCALPFLPPGPHTSAAAALAKLIAGKEV